VLLLILVGIDTRRPEQTQRPRRPANGYGDRGMETGSTENVRRLLVLGEIRENEWATVLQNFSAQLFEPGEQVFINGLRGSASTHPLDKLLVIFFGATENCQPLRRTDDRGVFNGKFERRPPVRGTK